MTDSLQPMIPDKPWQEPTWPYPPRFRWLKRGAILLVVTLLALGGLRWGWGKIADDRLAAMIAEAHARGEPILPEDFNPAPIPDSQNAAKTLRLAADSIVRDGQYDALDTTWTGGILTPAEAVQAAHVVSINQKSLHLCRVARSRSGVDWNIPLTRPVVMVLLSHLSSQRALSNLERLAAFHDHAVGNDAEAIERVRDILRQANAIDRRPNCAVTHLVGISIEEEALNALEQITPELRISRPEKDVAQITTAMRALIGELLDESELREALIRTWQAERMFTLDTATYVAGTGLSSPIYTTMPPAVYRVSQVTGPLTKLAGMRSADRFPRIAAAAAQPDWQRAAANLPQSLTGDQSVLEDLSQIFGQFEQPYDRAIQTHFKLLTDRRAVAVELALRLYRLDHSDHLPATLQELVPQYLPYVPLDPMAAGGRPIQYRPGFRPPVIYSVGVDGIDNGGVSLPTNIGGHWSQSADAVYPLEPLPAETQPSSEAQNHQ